MKKNILTYSVNAGTIDSCVNNIVSTIAKGQRNCNWLACINPHSYAVAQGDRGFSNALKAANWLVPDGVGIVIAGRILSQPMEQRITGADIFSGVMTALNSTGGSVFFLGGTEKTLGLIGKKVAVDFPSVRVAGTFSPPFKPDYSGVELDEMIELVNRSGAEVLWVGMTAPKQEKWIHDNCARLNVCFAGAIGAVFDFYTGQVRRSHPVFHKFGLEWLPRLAQEPRRLWRRMFVSAPIFLLDVMRERLGLPFGIDRSQKE